ncbi:MAG: DUF6760 family protein [Leptolyngbya sp. IPPAS B-1204]
MAFARYLLPVPTVNKALPWSWIWRGILGYPLDRLHEEVAYLGYHLHWSYESILQMEHRERRRWVEEIAKINQRLNTQTS